MKYLNLTREINGATTGFDKVTTAAGLDGENRGELVSNDHRSRSWVRRLQPTGPSRLPFNGGRCSIGGEGFVGHY
ncbi:hypothetical protein TIFTF001_029183 [Ficus carica]|uniref:Uncharacterized protein n=1 Tax=Ficus carica TaxID=3494 RepID=A0AA88J2I8_FICCA|nr:hypothetical protein TIFTF001_029183 [Ficus carica]